MYAASESMSMAGGGVGMQCSVPSSERVPSSALRREPEAASGQKRGEARVRQK